MTITTSISAPTLVRVNPVGLDRIGMYVERPGL